VPYGFATASSSSIARRTSSNGATFFVFLKALYRTSTTGPRRVVVITDNARYHHARLHRNWREEHADRFVLDYLPPYSPDLNPIERVCKLTRRKCLHNRYFPVLSEVVNSVEAQFTQWVRGNITCVAYAQLLRTPCLASVGLPRLVDVPWLDTPDFPATAVAAQFTASGALTAAIVFVRRDELDAVFLPEALVQRIAVVGTVADHSFLVWLA